jgi:hypothetical protein
MGQVLHKVGLVPRSKILQMLLGLETAAQRVVDVSTATAWYTVLTLLQVHSCIAN